MSSSREIEYTCPYCHEKFQMEIWDTVSADEDEDLHERCMSGDLFRYSCPHCHKDFMVEYPMTYIDRRHKFVIYLDENDVPSEILNMGKKLNRAGYTLRHVRTLKEFTEKLQILEDGVDDRLVELSKYDSFIEAVQNKKADPEEITSVEYQKTENEVMKINIRMSDKGMSFLIPVDGVQEEMDQNIERYRIDNSSFPEVNSDWMISLFEKPEGKA